MLATVRTHDVSWNLTCFYLVKCHCLLCNVSFFSLHFLQEKIHITTNHETTQLVHARHSIARVCDSIVPLYQR